MANRLRRFQAWLESALTRARSKELDVRHNPGLGVSNKPELEISKNTGLESSNKTSLETSRNTGLGANNNMEHEVSNEPGLAISNKLELETNRNTGLEANDMEHEISNESGLNISHKPGDSPSSDTSSQQEPPQANDTSSQQNPPPYCQHFGVRMLPKPTMPIKDDMPSIIRAAVGIAAAEGGPPAAESVAAVIETVARCVASVPAADAQISANVVTNAVADYVTALETEPGLLAATIFEQACDSVPASSKLCLSERFPEVLVHIRHTLSYIETWAPNGNLAPAIIYTVAQVTNSVAMLSESGTGRAIAEVWSNAAHRAVRIVSEGVDRAGSSTRPLPDSTGGDRAISNRSGGDCSSGELSNTNPGLGGCEAVLQTVRLRAAIGALRNYGEDTHILAALNALDAVAAGDYLPYTGEERLDGPTTCTCNRSCRRSCKALLQANRLRTALHALWTYNINVGNHKVVGVLAAVAAAAGLQPLPKDSDDSS